MSNASVDVVWDRDHNTFTVTAQYGEWTATNPGLHPTSDEIPRCVATRIVEMYQLGFVPHVNFERDIRPEGQAYMATRVLNLVLEQLRETPKT
jgi:hypothetical protein